MGSGGGGWRALKAICGNIIDARKMDGTRLNADWVERLMGYPDGWTDIEKDRIDRQNNYPALWINGSWDTIGRIVEEQKNRRKRIKGLGNAIVPQIAEYLWGLIKAAEEEKGAW
jgi:hypothetical protein